MMDFGKDTVSPKSQAQQEQADPLKETNSYTKSPYLFIVVLVEVYIKIVADSHAIKPLLLRHPPEPNSFCHKKGS
jgi:hypothetical protein